MELTVKESKVISNIVREVLNRFMDPDDAEKACNLVYSEEERTSSLLHRINELLIRFGYNHKLKEADERFAEDLASKIEVKVEPDTVLLKKDSAETVSVEITNKFDIPLVFEVSLEDRDNFLPIVYNKIEGAYFNIFSEERIIDTAATQKVKFKIGSGSDIKSPNTVIFIVIRSKEVEGLNWLGKLKVSLSHE